jgi:hypothetical protein
MPMTGMPASAEFLALQEAVAGRYSLERELGRGGMGVVFLACAQGAEWSGLRTLAARHSAPVDQPLFQHSASEILGRPWPLDG